MRAIYEKCERDACVVKNKLDARGHFCGAFSFSFVLIHQQFDMPTACLAMFTPQHGVVYMHTRQRVFM